MKNTIEQVICWTYDLSDSNLNLEQATNDTKKVIEFIEKNKDRTNGNFSDSEEAYIMSLMMKENDSNTIHYFEINNPERSEIINNIVHTYQTLDL